MGKTYRTMQGRQIDMGKLQAQNELMPAVGNLKVNARETSNNTRFFSKS